MLRISKSRLFIFNKLTAQRYIQEVASLHILPHPRTLPIQLSKRDTVGSRAARVTLDYFEQNVKLSPLPPTAYDLSSIERVCHYGMRYLSRKTPQTLMDHIQHRGKCTVVFVACFYCLILNRSSTLYLL